MSVTSLTSYLLVWVVTSKKEVFLTSVTSSVWWLPAVLPPWLNTKFM